METVKLTLDEYIRKLEDEVANLRFQRERLLSFIGNTEFNNLPKAENVESLFVDSGDKVIEEFKRTEKQKIPISILVCVLDGDNEKVKENIATFNSDRDFFLSMSEQDVQYKLNAFEYLQHGLTADEFQVLADNKDFAFANNEYEVFRNPTQTKVVEDSTYNQIVNENYDCGIICTKVSDEEHLRWKAYNTTTGASIQENTLQYAMNWCAKQRKHGIRQVTKVGNINGRK